MKERGLFNEEGTKEVYALPERPYTTKQKRRSRDKERKKEKEEQWNRIQTLARVRSCKQTFKVLPTSLQAISIYEIGYLSVKEWVRE